MPPFRIIEFRLPILQIPISKSHGADFDNQWGLVVGALKTGNTVTFQFRWILWKLCRALSIVPLEGTRAVR